MSMKRGSYFAFDAIQSRGGAIAQLTQTYVDFLGSRSSQMAIGPRLGNQVCYIVKGCNIEKLTPRAGLAGDASSQQKIP